MSPGQSISCLLVFLSVRNKITSSKEVKKYRKNIVFLMNIVHLVHVFTHLQLMCSPDIVVVGTTNHCSCMWKSFDQRVESLHRTRK